MAKLGFLGLGIMGGPMARHLLMAGHQVALWSQMRKLTTAAIGAACFGAWGWRGDALHARRYWTGVLCGV